MAHMRDRNMKFTSTEVNKLVQEWIYNLRMTEATSHISHVKQYETTFEKANICVEEKSKKVTDDDSNNYSTDDTDD
ncbi:unnamed protein product [Rotaria sp. Silwood1]|nr:unnamed protein product [Rotaria sp. Silwood1]